MYQTPDFIKRYPKPILTPDMVRPFYPADQTYNAGIAKYNGKYVMVFRNDYGCNGKEGFAWSKISTNLGFAFSDDGIRWEIASKPCWQVHTDEINRVYDPRLTVIDGKCYICFAMDTRHGLRGGVAVTEDFSRFEILSLSAPDNRNMVLFPEKIHGNFMRLERPLPIYSRGEGSESFDIWSSCSPDLRFWGDVKLVLGAEKVPYSNCKIGPGAPPVRTKYGWLCTTHAVQKVNQELYAWHKGWDKVYYTGLMLLDPDDPSKVLAVSKTPLLVPEMKYETEGMRGSVMFAGGMILEDSGEVKIYYGAADTVECLATADLGDLLNFVRQ